MQVPGRFAWGTEALSLWWASSSTSMVCVDGKPMRMRHRQRPGTTRRVRTTLPPCRTQTCHRRLTQGRRVHVNPISGALLWAGTGSLNCAVPSAWTLGAPKGPRRSLCSGSKWQMAGGGGVRSPTLTSACFLCIGIRSRSTTIAFRGKGWGWGGGSGVGVAGVGLGFGFGLGLHSAGVRGPLSHAQMAPKSQWRRRDWGFVASPMQGRPQNPGVAGETGLRWPPLETKGPRIPVLGARGSTGHVARTVQVIELFPDTVGNDSNYPEPIRK